MSALAALEAPPDRVHGSPRHDRMGGELTLDDLIVGTWEELAARAGVSCPVCASGTLRAQYGAHARPVQGRCRDCGAELS